MSSQLFDTKPFGNELPGYIARYWQTFVRKDVTDGNLCYFLHGGIEKIPQPKKDHTIQERMGILFSPIKWISVCEKKSKDLEKNKQMMKDRAIEEMDIIEDFSCYLNGDLISEHAIRAMSDFFELDSKYMAICDGYWIFIKPYQLSLGKHYIVTHAACRAGEVIRPSEFNLTIV
jgi:hypothetical protein